MVEELLNLFVGVVDAELFVAVLDEDFKASNVEDANESGFVGGSVKSIVDPVDEGAD